MTIFMAEGIKDGSTVAIYPLILKLIICIRFVVLVSSRIDQWNLLPFRFKLLHKVPNLWAKVSGFPNT